MKKRGLIWLLIISILSGLCISMPIIANAAYGSFSSDIKWEITEDGLLAIGGSGEMPDCTAIGTAPWGSYADEITSVYIKPGITSIGNYALSGLTNISSISLPDTITRIGDFAFSDNKALVDVYLSKSLNTLGKGAFRGCNLITSLSINDENEYFTLYDGCLYDKEKTILILSVPGMAKASLTLPDSVTAIDDYALCGNALLGNIKIPASVKTIGNGVFSDCPMLSTVYYMGTSNQWAEISIGTDNHFLSNLTENEKIIFDYINATSLTLNVSELELSVGARRALIPQILPENASDKTIEWTSSDEDIVSVTPEGIITAQGEGVATITATNRVENLSASCTVNVIYVHLEHMSLNKAELDLNVYESEKLNVIFTPANASVRDLVWSSSSPYVATVEPDGTVYAQNGGTTLITAMTSDGYEATCMVNVTLTGEFGNGLRWTITMDDSTTAATNGGTLTISGEGEVPDYTYTVNDGSVAGSTASGSDAPWSPFYHRITKIVIEDGITAIGNFAFADCKYTDWVTMPDSVTSMGIGVFAGNPYIYSFEVSDTNTAFSTINGSLFNKDKTILIAKATQGGEFYEIPETVTEIAPYAFYANNKARYITFNKSIEAIGDYAFENNSADVKFYYKGSEEEWNNVAIGAENYALDNITCGLTYAKGMSLSEHDIALNTGESIKLDAIFTPTNASITDVEWFSSDGNIAGIGADGTVWAQNAGIATIKAISKDGGFIDKCTVSVTGKGLCGNNVEWTLTPDCETLTLHGFGETYDYFYDGTQPWNSYNKKIKRVVVENGITGLGNYLFTRMSECKIITLPDGLERIRNSAFYSCEKLVNLTIPDSVHQIDESAFSSCTSLKNIKLPEGLTTINSYIFTNCEQLSALIIPDSVEKINYGVFQNCKNLKTLVFGANLRYIGTYNFPKHLMTPITVFYKGTKDDWESITYEKYTYNPNEDDNDRLHDANVIYCNEASAKITLNSDEIELWVGDSSQLTATVLPENTASVAKWSSSDESIATVSADGTVTAHSNGTAIITAATIDGRYSANCTVTAKAVPANGMYIEEASVNLVRDRDYQLKIVFTPENTTNKKLKWTSSDENVVRVTDSSGIIYAVGEGSATVTAVSEDGGFTDSCTVNVAEIIASGTLKDSIEWQLDFNGTLIINGKGALPDFELPRYSDKNNSTDGRNSAAGAGTGTSADGNPNGSDKIENADKVAPWYDYSYEIRYISLSHGITAVGNYAFNHCGKLNYLYLPNTVTSVGDYAFAYNYNLNSISLPDSLVSIGDYAFAYNNNLNSIGLQNSLVSIGDYAFYNTNLQYLDIPKNVSDIGEGAFAATPNLSSIWVAPENEYFTVFDGTLLDVNKTRLIKHTNGAEYYNIPSSVKVIEPYAFYNNYSLRQVSLYNGLEEIGQSAFGNCSSLTSVWLPHSLKKLGTRAFSQCYQLNEINIPDNITEIPAEAFWSCNSLQSIALNNIKKIGNNAFSYCNVLNSIMLPESLTEIGNGAFEGSALNSIILPDGLLKIGERAFMSCNIPAVDIPSNVAEIGTMAFTSQRMENIYVSEDNAAYTDIDGVLFNKAKTDIICYPGAKLAPVYIIPEGTITIKSNAFSRTAQHSVIIPDGVTTIEDRAFREAHQLSSISIPESVTSIGQGAFSNTNLTTLALPSGITEIPSEFLSYCNNITELTLGENVKTIASYAINGCSKLNTVKISSALENVSRWAFRDCPIENVLYSGSEADWDAITIAEGNDSLLNATLTANSKFVTGLSLDKTTLTLPIDAEAFLTATISPQDAENTEIEWTSMDPGIASVTPDGNVTAMSSGTAVIKAIAMDGGYTAYCTVYVGEEGSFGEGFTWNFSGDGTLTITGEGPMPEFNEENPDDPTMTANPIPWAGITPMVKRIVIEEGITSISGRAFENMHITETVSLPSTLTSIGKTAFFNCHMLKEITIPASVESIGENAFLWCHELSCINIEADNESYASHDGVLFNKDKTVLLLYPMGKTDAEYTIPLSVLEVAPYAFREALFTTLIINSGLETISDFAFAECFNLKNLVIPSSVTTLGENTFGGIVINSVVYEGSREEFDTLLESDTSGGSASAFNTATIICNSTMPINAMLTYLSCKDGELEAIVTFSSLMKPATAFLALYDREGKLVSTSSKPVRLNDTPAAADISFVMPVDNEYPGYTVKIFFWDAATLKPLANSVTGMIPTTQEWPVIYESAHNYANNTDEPLQGFTYDKACVSIDVTFSADTDTEKGQDFIYIYGENNTLIGKYSGNELAGKTINIPGNTFMIRLTSDSMIRSYGYKTEKIVINKI